MRDKQGKQVEHTGKEWLRLFLLRSIKVGTIDGYRFGVMILTKTTFHLLSVSASRLGAANVETEADTPDEQAKESQGHIAHGTRRSTSSTEIRPAFLD